MYIQYSFQCVEDKDKKKAYSKLLEASIKDKNQLYANRRGIVLLHSFIDKPAITAAELSGMKWLGLSYKQIGRKLGIDGHKQGVIQVFEAVGTDVKAIKSPAKISPPTPLWYLFESERELIKSYILPSTADIKQFLPQHRLVERLGENVGFMLHNYLKVNDMVNEEIQSGASSSSSVGIRKNWDGDLASSIIQKVSNIQGSIGQAALHLSDYYECADVGRCVCSASKSLRFGWKEEPLPHPSFLGGGVAAIQHQWLSSTIEQCLVMQHSGKFQTR